MLRRSAMLGDALPSLVLTLVLISYAPIKLSTANILPFFDDKATNGGNAWGVVNWSLDFFRQRAPGKRIVMVSCISIHGRGRRRRRAQVTLSSPNPSPSLRGALTRASTWSEADSLPPLPDSNGMAVKSGGLEEQQRIRSSQRLE